MAGYAKQRANWQDFPTTSTPILAAILNAWETSLYELKRGVRLYASDYGVATGGTAAANKTAMSAALADCDSAGGGAVALGPGTFNFTDFAGFAGIDNVRLVGAGTQATAVRTSTTTGNIFDFTGSSFCAVEDLSFVADTERTAGAVFYLDAAAGSCQRNEFRRLRIHGGWRAWHLDDCTTTTIDEIQVTDFDATHDWHSVINLAGAATSTMLSNIRGGTAASVTNSLLLIDGATVDTVHCHNFDVLNLSPSTGMYGVIVANGQWIHLTDCSFESGTTKDAVVVNGGRDVHLNSCHLLGLRGLLVNGGTGVQMHGGTIVGCYNGGVSITGGTHHKIQGVTISDCSVQTNNTYNGISVSAGVTDFDLCDNVFGDMMLSGNDMATAITVAAGASDRYRITGNRVGATGVLTPFSENGTGTDKIVKDNVAAGIGFPSVASAATVTLPANAEVVNITGTTNITSVVASYKGRRVTLKFAGVLTFTNGSNLKLAGNFVTTADDTISLICDGTNWHETGRVVVT